MGFVFNATLSLKLWDAFTTFAPIGKYDCTSLKKTYSAALAEKRDLDELRRNYKQETASL